ncbi:MAG TPA: rhomboid family intramembrane serine protease [Longimicrobiales bacterium]|nr:rhomboid family intramembrane serine protease [Longimicrobiales bacterium]
MRAWQRTNPGSFGFGFGYPLTPWVKRLLIANAAAYLLFGFLLPDRAWSYAAFVPSQILFRPWTPLTYMFLHAGFFHLFFNMLALFFFGPPLEERWGSREFLKYYLICGLGGAVLSFVFAPNAAVVGASAAVFGIMLAFAMNWPDSPIYIWGIFPVKAKWLVAILAGLSLLSAVQGVGDGIAHFAHLGGFVAGFLYLKVDAPRGHLAGLKKRFSRSRLTVIPGGKTGPTPTVKRASRPAREEERVLDEVDRVLDKISTQGMSSLSAEERRLLDEVSRRYRRD